MDTIKIIHNQYFHKLLFSLFSADIERESPLLEFNWSSARVQLYSATQGEHAPCACPLTKRSITWRISAIFSPVNQAEISARLPNQIYQKHACDYMKEVSARAEISSPVSQTGLEISVCAEIQKNLMFSARAEKWLIALIAVFPIWSIHKYMHTRIIDIILRCWQMGGGLKLSSPLVLNLTLD